MHYMKEEERMQISCEIMTFGAESLEAQVRASMLKSPGYSFKPSHIHFFFFFFYTVSLPEASAPTSSEARFSHPPYPSEDTETTKMQLF